MSTPPPALPLLFLPFSLSPTFAFAGPAFSMRRRQRYPTPVQLLGKPHGWRSLVGCSPWGCEESDTTKRLHFTPLQEYSTQQGSHSDLMEKSKTLQTRQNVPPHAMKSAAAAAKSLQSCLTLRNPMDCSLPGSSVHGIFQAKVLEWGAITFSDYEV